MRIAIINMTGGGMSGGYRKYLRNVIPRMAAHPGVEALLCASPDCVNIKDLFSPLPSVKFVNCTSYRLFGYGNNSELIRCLRDFSPDVLFVPTERFFRLGEIPVVNMIRNMEPFVSRINGYPISERLKILVKSVDGKRTIRKANRIIAISKFVRDFLVQNWKIQPERIGLVHHGVDLSENKNFHQPDIIPRPWDGRFLFTAGSIRPARGLEDALWAMKQLILADVDIYGLVIAGEADLKMSSYMKKLKNWVDTHNLSSKVCWAGNLNESEMSWCYQNCSAFIMTSRVEACPNIALESMSHGCVCISADSPPLPEIFGETAIFYPPINGKALAEAIQTVLASDSNLRNEASERARKQASKFSWDVCAEKTVAELAKAVGSRQSVKL